MRMITLVLAVALLAGCSNSYRITDPQTGRVYYSDKKPKRMSTGAIIFEDLHRKTVVTLCSSEIVRVPDEEAGAGTPPWEPRSPDPAVPQ